MSGTGVIDRRQVLDRRQVRSAGRDLYERLEDKRLAVDMERRHQRRRQGDTWSGEPQGPQGRENVSPDYPADRAPEGDSAKE
jgi:hypothetical protein